MLNIFGISFLGLEPSFKNVLFLKRSVLLRWCRFTNFWTFLIKSFVHKLEDFKLELDCKIRNYIVKLNLELKDQRLEDLHGFNLIRKIIFEACRLRL